MAKSVLWGDAMAQKRMFSLRVVETDKFLEMPTSTQCLYFHLGMHGDDDGFVASPKKITTLCGCNLDDLRLLASKGFIYPFESGVCVITDWRINNTLKNDRYSPTLYATEKALLLAENPNWFQDGSKTEPQHNITKHNKTKKSCAASQRSADTRFEDFWKSYPKKKDKAKAQKAFAKVIAKTNLDTMLHALEEQKRSQEWQKDGGQYIPLPSTWLNGERWTDETSPIEPTYSYTPRPDILPEYND